IGACLWESNSARRGYRVRAKPLGGLIRPRPQQNRLRPLTGDERAHRNISAGHTLHRPRTSPAPKPSSPSLRAAASPTIWCVLHEAGLRWSKDRSWCETGTVSRKRKPGTVTLIDPMRSDRGRVYAGQLAGMDRSEAGPYQTIPYPGSHWHPTGQAVRYPHEYVCAGTAKHLRLFHPASGQVRVKGVRKCSYAVLHPWLEAELTAILATLPVLV